MSSPIEYLESLNRKERFFVVGAALGKPAFRLDSTFRQKLSDKFKLSVPSTAFVAMDYHLDWIYASLHLSTTDPNAMGLFDNKSELLTGNQEDVDLLVAYEADGITHIIMLEAKAETNWTKKQTDSKARRLGAIFGPNGNDNYPLVRPHFGLWSPRPPEGLGTEHWPTWMRSTEGGATWLELNVPEGRRRVIRCNDGGQPDQHGHYFKTTLRRGSTDAP